MALEQAINLLWKKLKFHMRICWASQYISAGKLHLGGVTD